MREFAQQLASPVTGPEALIGFDSPGLIVALSRPRERLLWNTASLKPKSSSSLRVMSELSVTTRCCVVNRGSGLESLRSAYRYYHA